MIICSGNRENFKFATPIGIGLIHSAINLTRICMLNPPEFLIFIGTAGSYGRLNIFDIVNSYTSSNIENSFFSGNSYSPINNIISTSKEFLKKNIVNSSNYITSNIDISKEYLERNIDLENMEFYSVLKVAEEFNISVSGIFIISNFCDKNAHKDFNLNHEKSMFKLVEHLYNKNILKEILLKR